MERLAVWIYRSSRRAETFLYLPGPEDLTRVPAGLVEAMGSLVFVMELELHPTRRLAREDPARVMRNVSENGYHLQLPPVDTPGSGRVQ